MAAPDMGEGLGADVTFDHDSLTEVHASGREGTPEERARELGILLNISGTSCWRTPNAIWANNPRPRRERMIMVTR